MAFLAEHRLELFISALGIAEIDVQYDGDGLSASIHCATCSLEILLSEDRQLYECENCGIEVTKREAEDLAKQYVTVVTDAFVESQEDNDERGFLWRLRTLFGGTRKRQASLKP